MVPEKKKKNNFFNTKAFVKLLCCHEEIALTGHKTFPVFYSYFLFKSSYKELNKTQIQWHQQWRNRRYNNSISNRDIQDGIMQYSVIIIKTEETSF